MDVKTYLHTRKEALGKQNRRHQRLQRIRLQLHTEQPLMRDEARIIIDAILRYEHTGIPKTSHSLEAEVAEKPSWSAT